MTFTRTRLLSSAALLSALALAACSGTADAEAPDGAQGQGAEIEVTHARGTTTVPVAPQTVVTFDIATYDLLDRLGVEVAGAPVDFLPERLAASATDVAPVGDLFEPDFEAVNELAPDLIVVAGRSSEQLPALSEIAPTIDLSNDWTDFRGSIEANAEIVGQVFDMEAEVAEMLSEIDTRFTEVGAQAADAGNALIVLTSAGEVTAYGPGSRFGWVHDDLGLTPAIEDVEEATHGEAVSFEFIAEADPDWLVVVDRDISTGEATAAAEQVLDNELVRGTTAWQQDQVIYVDPVNWYIVNGGAGAGALGVAVVVVLGVLAPLSMFVGVQDLTPATLLSGDEAAWRLLVVSRLPRAASILLAGSALAIAGLLVQILVRNRFVEPTTIGTTEAAGLGLLLVTLLAPGMPLLGKMAIASAAGLAGTGLFLRLVRAVPMRSVALVPLIGLMLSGVIGAVSTFIAYRWDLLQTLSNWMTGDFSGVIQGRYELLWLVLALTVVAWLAADRFTVAGMGGDVATNLGLNHRAVTALGLVVVAVVSAVVFVVVGALPFLGLVVPNVASILLGDRLRRSVPWVALGGAGLVLVCDVVGRLLRYPYEIPIDVVMGVVGAAGFLWLLLRRGARVG